MGVRHHAQAFGIHLHGICIVLHFPFRCISVDSLRAGRINLNFHKIMNLNRNVILIT